MSEKIEQVARALCECDGYHPDEPVVMLNKPDGKGFRWEFHVGKARAAIAAMREPTEAMADAGMNHTGDPCWQEDVKDAWRAMIDEALK